MAESMSIVPYQSYNHAVEVEEKHDEVEPQLEKRFLANVNNTAWTTRQMYLPFYGHSTS